MKLSPGNSSGNDDPIGGQVRLKMLESMPQGRVDNAVFEIIGVVADAKNQRVQEAALTELFIPYQSLGPSNAASWLAQLGVLNPEAVQNPSQDIVDVNRTFGYVGVVMGCGAQRDAAFYPAGGAPSS